MGHLEKMSLDKQTRIELWQQVFQNIETYIEKVHQARVAPEMNPDEIRSLLSNIDFTRPLDPREAIDFVVNGLWKYQVHTPHSRYFGLFNPAPTTMSIAADALVAAFNPQLATWSHSPFAVEVEHYLILAFARQFGYDSGKADGTFASGGAEANHTAILTALSYAFPEYSRRGLRGLDKQPVMYVSSQSHHSFFRAARANGLGTDAVRQIPVDARLQMNIETLAKQIVKDRTEGFAPFLIVATAGTTNAGVVDPISCIADVASHEKLWFHVDAAWGGAAILIPEFDHLFKGIERSDSITFDTHKWLSVPMGAGIYLTRHLDILGQTFRITTDYIPKDEAGLEVVNPYIHSIQCSRRFTGLKVFLSLAVAGWDGYRAVIRHQIAMGDLLRRELEAAGWEVVNQTELPVVCFIDRQNPEGRLHTYLETIVNEIVSSGDAWISTTRLGQDLPVLRACITNYQTVPEDIFALVHNLNKAREKVNRTDPASLS